MPSDLLVDFGTRVREARTARGWSQAGLAELARLTQKQISFIERGERDVRLSTLVRVLAALELPASDLVDDLRH